MYTSEVNAMNTMDTGLHAQMSTTATRLITDIEAAARDGSWAATEISRLHMWLTAELLPWAKTWSVHLPHHVAGEVTRHMVTIAHLDAQLLGTAGKHAAHVALMLEDTISCLVDDIAQVTELRGATIPQQRDTVD